MTNLLSDADCGPSNALSSFSKHSQQDRTLQQDRWVPGSRRPQDSFRTTDLGPEQATLQRNAQEFFQQGPPVNTVPSSYTQFQRSPIPSADNEDWHRQFQRVHLSPSPSTLSETQLAKQPAIGLPPPPSAWQDEFTKFQGPPSRQMDLNYQPQAQQRLASMAYTTALPPSSMQLPQQQSTFVDAQFADEAFELAFAEAEHAAHSFEEPLEEDEPKLSEGEEADRLAQTAGELFDKLKYERDMDEKFRNSTFMALMKKLRDREVVLKGNQMVERSELEQMEEAVDEV